MVSTTPRVVRRKCAALFGVCGLVMLLPFCASAANVTLAWDPSPDPVVGYKLYWGGSSRNYTNSVSVGNVTAATISNLAQGVTYYFAATATDTNGLESDFSNEASGTAGNQPPTLNLIANVTVSEDPGAQTVNLSGISSGSTSELQTLAVTASSSNPSLIPTPTVNYTSPNATGTLTFTPVASASGSATITVTVNDGGSANNTISRQFTVTVSAVNDVPTLNALANLVLSENAGLQTVQLSGISSGAANENQTLTVTATSSNPTLVPTPTVNYTSPNSTGTLTFTPAASSSGSSTITVTVRDGGTSNNVVSRQFTVTVDQVNQRPTISAIANQAIAMDTSTGPLAFTIGDRETAATSLAIWGSSDNTVVVPNASANIVFGGSGTNRTVTVTPAPGQTGVAYITITVSDGSQATTSTFRLSVSRKPRPPGNLRKN